MTNTELNTKIAKVENLEQLMADLRNAMDEEEIKEVLKAHGLDITLEDLAVIRLESDELAEDDLDDVAGGCKCKGPLKWLVTTFLCWVSKQVTGKKMKCPDCGH